MMSKTIPRWIQMILGVLKFLYLLSLLFYLIDYSMLGDGRRFAFQGLDEVIESQGITSLTIAALIGLLLEYTGIYVCVFRIKDWTPNFAYLLMHISVVPFYLYYSNFHYLWALYVGSMITSIFLLYKLIFEEPTNGEKQMDDAELEVRSVPKNRATENPSQDYRSKRNETQKTTSNVINHTEENNDISQSGSTQGLNQLSTNSLPPCSYQPSAPLALSNAVNLFTTDQLSTIYCAVYSSYTFDTTYSAGASGTVSCSIASDAATLCTISPSGPLSTKCPFGTRTTNKL